MEKLDRIRWVWGTSITAFGVRVGIRMTDPSVWPDIQKRLPPNWRFSKSNRVKRIYSFVLGGQRPGSHIRRYHIVYSNYTRIQRTHDLDSALSALEADLQLYVAEKAPGKVFLHAGAVSWGDKIILIPGASYSGKSHLVKALVEEGATYLSDEFAVLDARGWVWPYPKALRIRDRASPSGALRAGALPHEAQVSPGPVELIVTTRYAPGKRWSPHPLSPGRTVLELLRHTVPARHRPRQAIAVLTRIALDALSLKGGRGEAGPTAKAILLRMREEQPVIPAEVKG